MSEKTNALDKALDAFWQAAYDQGHFGGAKKDKVAQDAEAVLRAAISALFPPPLDHVEGLAVDSAWSALCEMEDRTSPAEYPDHALITKAELADFMRSAFEHGASPALGLGGALAAIAAERQRQIAKGYDAAHDDSHKGGEIVLADWGARARIEAAITAGRAGDSPAYKELLTEAAAQCVAEIERVERAEGEANA